LPAPTVRLSLTFGQFAATSRRTHPENARRVQKQDNP
jgi:hypothetical protein